MIATHDEKRLVPELLTLGMIAGDRGGPDHQAAQRRVIVPTEFRTRKQKYSAVGGSHECVTRRSGIALSTASASKSRISTSAAPHVNYRERVNLALRCRRTD
jgi:hypothetical protein